MMKPKRQSPSQIVESLNRAERMRNDGQSIASICQELGISRPTYYRWKRDYGGMTSRRAEDWAAMLQDRKGLLQSLGEQSKQVEILRNVVEGSLVSPSRKREAIRWLDRQMIISERQACRALSQHRSTQRYRPQTSQKEEALRERVEVLSQRYSRFGYRRICAMLRREGWHVNPKRIHRIRRSQGLTVKALRKRSGKGGATLEPENVICADGKNVVWAWDVIDGWLAGGRSAKWLTVIDEYTRELLALEVAKRTSATWVIATLEQILTEREPPEFLRSDNTRPFVTDQVDKWLRLAGIPAVNITPGSPWENGHVEAFHARLRDEFLNVEEFASMDEAKRRTAIWRDHYNHVRVHSALNYLTPAEFAATLE
ncbi:MAG: IS3 family transposase [Planctomycetota bacterium]|nr:MAG: IS3 family transposase [Planctomycetota bacterium]REK28029.1 MAG: IS3 family transposase [Planctomycetota bacterium]REK37556.1 MAG: IS3 family transposase [Planctomycetota bacterium]